MRLAGAWYGAEPRQPARHFLQEGPVLATEAAQQPLLFPPHDPGEGGALGGRVGIWSTGSWRAPLMGHRSLSITSLMAWVAVVPPHHVLQPARIKLRLTDFAEISAVGLDRATAMTAGA